MRKILAIAVLAAALFIAAWQLGMLSLPVGHHIYLLTRKYILVNNLSYETAVDLNQMYPRLMLAPSIAGWQENLGYRVFIDGVDKTKMFTLQTDNDGNTYLVYTGGKLKLRPGEALNITFVQKLSVEVPPPVGSRARHALPEHVVIDKRLAKYLNVSGFWSYKPKESDNTLESLVSSILSKSHSKREYILNSIEWVLEHVKYPQSGVMPGIAPPYETAKKGVGACGDRSALLIYMFRKAGIPSYMYLSYVFSPGSLVRETGGGVEVVYRNALPHAFAMVYVGRELWVPVDTTVPYRRPGEALLAVNQAGANILPSLVVYCRVVKSDPNDLMYVVPPSKGVSMKMYVEMAEVKNIHSMLPISGASISLTWFVSAILLLLLAVALYRRAPSF